MLSAAICKTNGLSAFVIFSCLLQQWCSFSCSVRTSVCAARCRVSSFFRCWSFDVDRLPGMPWGVRVAGRTSRVSRRQQRASLSGRLREINFEFCPLCVLSLRYGLCHRAWLPPLVRRPWGRSLFSRILCTFLTLFPPPGRYLRLRGGWNALRRRYCRANHSGEWRGRRRPRLTASPFFVLSPTSNDRLPRPPYVATSPTSLASTGVLPEAKVAHFRDMLWLVSSCFEACTLNASRDALRARTRCWPSWHSSAPSASSATCWRPWALSVRSSARVVNFFTVYGICLFVKLPGSYHQRRLVVPLAGAWRASSLRGRVWLQLVKSRTLVRILREKKHFAKHIAASTMRFLTSLEEITGKVWWIYKSYERSSIYQILLTSRCMHYRLFSAWVKIGISSFSVASHVDNCFFRAAFQSSNRHQCSPLRGSLCLCQRRGLQKFSKLVLA